MDRIEAVVIGAGVIGLAIARELALAGRSVIILEKQAQFGTGLSSRNSEVVHAGLYYPPGSLKERFCIEGRELLYAYCERRSLPHRRCGKLIVASNTGELPALEAIARRGEAAGVANLRILDQSEAAALEPALACAAALHSPSTGIVDSHALMLSMLGEAEDRGAVLARNTPADRIERMGDAWRIQSGETAIDCSIVVNAAGLSAHCIAQSIEALDKATIPPLYLAKGNYFSYAGKVPFSHLIYPVPVQGGLGTHLTLDMGGQARFGPDVEWIEHVDIDVDQHRKSHFADAARRFWPQIDADKLVPAYAGIRPKLSGPGDPPADFVISGEQTHGLPGLVNLFGMESPGLTASFAIARHVSGMVEAG